MATLTLDGSGNGSTESLPTIPGLRYLFALATELDVIGGVGAPLELTHAGFATEFQASLEDPTALSFDLSASRGIRMEFTASGANFLFSIVGGDPALVVEYNLVRLPL